MVQYKQAKKVNKQVNIIKDEAENSKGKNTDIALENDGKIYSDTEYCLPDSAFWFLVLWFMFNFKVPQRIKPFICIRFQKQR